MDVSDAAGGALGCLLPLGLVMVGAAAGRGGRVVVHVALGAREGVPAPQGLHDVEVGHRHEDQRQRVEQDGLQINQEGKIRIQ